MTGPVVATDALLAHSNGSQGAANNFAALANLLEQARVSDDCFGPIGEFFAQCYFNGLEECQGLAGQAAAFLTEVSGRVADSARLYRETDQSNAEGLGRLESRLADGGGGPGSLSDLNNAGDKAGYWEQHGGYGSSTYSAYQDYEEAKRTGDPPDIAIATVNGRAEQLQWVTSPGQAFIDNGLGWLISLVISPLVEFVIEPAVGDPEQMRSTAEGWGNVAKWLDNAAEHEKNRAEATSEAWQGEAGDAFRQQMFEFSEGAHALATDVRYLEQILNTGADLFDFFVETVVDILQELVMGLIIEWLAALAASWISGGASVAAASAMTTRQVSTTGARLGLKVKDLQRTLYKIFKDLEGRLQDLRKGRLRGVVEKMEDMRKGGFAQEKMADRLDRNPLFKAVTKADAGDLKDAKRSVEAAEDAVRQGRPGAADDLADARQKLDKARDSASMATKSPNKYFGKDAVGEEALAQHAARAGLNVIGLSGTTNVGTAVFRGTLENVPGAAVEQGIQWGYLAADDPSTEDERREIQQRGFEL